MLIVCPDCESMVSDRAYSCPHCGYPMKSPSTPKRQYNRKPKRMRLPNGFGQITEIKGKNLRKPFRAMVTVGKTEEGKPISKLLKPEAYFETYNDAYTALVEYNKNPYDASQDITMEELYTKWSDRYYKDLGSKSTVATHKSAWKYCQPIYKMKVRDIKIYHIKQCIEENPIAVPVNMKQRVKNVLSLMLDYAIEYEIIDKNCARNFKLSAGVAKEEKNNKKDHISFTDEEMNGLWSHVNDIPYIDVIIIQCYSGWRPRELGLIKLENVDLKNWTFSGGMKTDAGTNRIVPIHSSIRGLVARRYKEAQELGSYYLLNYISDKCDDIKFTYDRYRHIFKRICSILKLNEKHRPHDCRVQFVTMAKQYNVDEYAIKYMVGHAIDDLTENIYTKRDVSWLQEEIEKIKGPVECMNNI